MKQDVKSIRKQFRITELEEKRIKEMMKEQKIATFSEFLRQNLLKDSMEQERILTIWFSLWELKKLEQISRDIYEILIISRVHKQVTQEHVAILLACVKELIEEVNQYYSLSPDFHDKYRK